MGGTEFSANQLISCPTNSITRLRNSIQDFGFSIAVDPGNAVSNYSGEWQRFMRAGIGCQTCTNCGKVGGHWIAGGPHHGQYRQRADASIGGGSPLSRAAGRLRGSVLVA